VSLERFQGTWVGRCILDGHAIADEYLMSDMSGRLVVLGLNLRAYSASKQTWNIQADLDFGIDAHVSE
jgi:hypothetical protein